METDLKTLRWSKLLATKLSRYTTSVQFIPEIDGLRFIAIFYVVLFHLSQRMVKVTGRTTEYDPLVSFLSHGHFGVQFFFVISGAVIALPFAKGHLLGECLPNFKNYFLRRLTRLEPPYIVHLLILFALLIMVVADNSVSKQLPHLLASIGYLHNIIYGKPSVISNVAWSLEIEFQFYVLAPFITRIFMIKSETNRRILLILLIALFTLVSFLLKDSRAALSVLCNAHFFMAGFLLIDVYIADWKQTPNKSIGWDILSVLSWFSVVTLLYQGELGKALFVVPLLIAYCGAFRGKLSNWVFRQPLVYIIGGMCYTIYLFHFTIIVYSAHILNISGLSGLYREFFLNYPLWLVIITSSLIVIPIVIFISALFFIFIEKPCMRKDWHIKLSENFRTTFLANKPLPSRNEYK